MREQEIRDVAAFAEPVEAAAWADFCDNAPVEVVEQAGVRMERVGDAVASAALRFDVLAINRVFGLGVGEPATETGLDRLLSIYSPDAPPRLAVQVVPGAQPAELESWLYRRGFRPLNNLARLHARCTSLPDSPAESAIRIDAVKPDGAAAFGRICSEAFGWPDVFGPWAAASVGRPGWHHLMAFDGELPVATGALFVRGPVGWLGMAATRRDHRRRGAQTALLLERFRIAKRAGCEWLVVETAEDSPDRPAPSYRNLIRLGFRLAYLRPNWVRSRGDAGTETGATPRTGRD